MLAEADDQNHADMEVLAGALRQKGAIALNYVAVRTDHGFSDHRIALQAIVIEWLEEPRDLRHPTGINRRGTRDGPSSNRGSGRFVGHSEVGSNLPG